MFRTKLQLMLLFIILFFLFLLKSTESTHYWQLFRRLLFLLYFLFLFCSTRLLGFVVYWNSALDDTGVHGGLCFGTIFTHSYFSISEKFPSSYNTIATHTFDQTILIHLLLKFEAFSTQFDSIQHLDIRSIIDSKATVNTIILYKKCESGLLDEMPTIHFDDIDRLFREVIRFVYLTNTSRTVLSSTDLLL